MANYLIQSCDGLTSLVVNPGENTITTGNTYYINFTGETNPGCFEVTSESEDPIAEGISTATQYNSCLECLQDNGFSFIVTGCTLPIGGPVSAVQFNEWPLGNFYTLCANNGEFDGCLCFEVIGIEPSVYPFNFTILGPYSDCECQEPPRSANTEVFLCQEICTSGGTTTVSITPPHPVWTDGYGTPVTQLNMIVLGGPNGLNN
jgi:hypothetical protein